MRTESLGSSLFVAAGLLIGALGLGGVAGVAMAWQAGQALEQVAAEREAAQLSLEMTLSAQVAVFEEAQAAGVELDDAMRALAQQAAEAERPEARAVAAGRLSAQLSQSLSAPAAEGEDPASRRALAFALIQGQERLAEAAAQAQEAEDAWEGAQKSPGASLAQRVGWGTSP